ncbi:hypothetical protein ABFW14_13690, partial [Mycolicibacterium fortuitum]
PGGPGSSLSVAMTTAPEIYRASIDDIGLCLAQQPLYQLQRLPGADTNDTFLYDDSFLHSNVSPPDAARAGTRSS